jgi:hypothetical protein
MILHNWTLTWTPNEVKPARKHVFAASRAMSIVRGTIVAQFNLRSALPAASGQTKLSAS